MGNTGNLERLNSLTTLIARTGGDIARARKEAEKAQNTPGCEHIGPISRELLNIREDLTDARAKIDIVLAEIGALIYSANLEAKARERAEQAERAE